MMAEHETKIPIYKALSWILGSALAVSLLIGLGFFYFQQVKHNHANNSAYHIVAIIQTTSCREPLNTAYLAELLDLSTDQPTNLYRFNCKEARKRLLATPLIEKAEVKKIRPGSVLIDYEMRQPIAFLSDFSNTALDKKGHTFPFSPFFTPKILPEIYLGIASQKEEGKFSYRKSIDFALELLDYIVKHYCDDISTIRRIDVSQAYAQSYGQRQIVVTFEDQISERKNGKNLLYIFPRVLRLSTENYKLGLANYFELHHHLIKHASLNGTEAIVKAQPLFIDLRLPHLAYIKGET